MTNYEVVVYALYLIEGALKYCDLEDIAIKAYALSSAKFSWRKYPERIDLRIVQDALKSATNDYNYILGSIKKGYILTSKGINLAESFTIDEFENNNTYRKQSISEKEHSEAIRMRNSMAYKKYYCKQYKLIKEFDFNNFCRVNEYFDLSMREKKFNQINNIVNKYDDLNKLWKYLRKKFLGVNNE